VYNSTSVNLFKILWAALSNSGEFPVLLTDQVNFPSDLYIDQGLSSVLQGRLKIRITERERLEKDINSDVTAVFLTHVDFAAGCWYKYLNGGSRCSELCLCV
jgi:kynureninase